MSAETAQLIGDIAGEVMRLGDSFGIMAGNLRDATSAFKPLTDSMETITEPAGILNTVLDEINTFFYDINQGIIESSIQIANWAYIIQGFEAGGVGEVWSRIKEKWGEAFDGISIETEANLQRIDGSWETLRDNVTRASETTTHDVKDHWSTLHDDLVGHSIIPNMIKEIVARFEDLPEKAAGAIKAGLGKLKEAGKAIIEGLKEGIENAWDGFFNWITGKIQGLVNGILGALGYESPPDWAVDAGAAIVRGLQLGMQSQFGALSNTVGAMAGIVTGATFAPPRFSTVTANALAGGRGYPGGWGGAGAMPPPGGNSYGGDTYYVNINDAVAAAMFAANVRARRGDRLNQRMGR